MSVSPMDTISTIYGVGIKIYEHYKLVQANKHQSKALNDRVQRVVQTVVAAEHLKYNQIFIGTLRNLKLLLDDIDAYFNELARRSHAYLKTLGATGMSQRFADYNQQLSMFSQELQLAFDVQGIHNQESDRLACQKDQDELAALLLSSQNEVLDTLRTQHAQTQAMAEKNKEALDRLLQVKEVEDIQNELEIQARELKNMELIYEGTTGDIFKAKRRGAHVAVKLFNSRSLPEKAMAEFKREMKNAIKLRSEYIVPFLGICTKPPFLAIVMQLMSGSLADLLYKSGKTLTWNDKLRMAEEIALGVLHLHTSNPEIIHRNITTQNILLDKDDHCKLADFGLALVRQESSGSSETKGTVGWIAPELIDNDTRPPYSVKSDVYALAITYFELIAQQKPYEGKKPFQIFRAVARGERPDIKALQCPDKFKLLITRCWHPQPELRPTMEEIVEEIDSLKSVSFPCPT